MRILVVEDDDVLGEAITTRFRRQGHGVDLVQKGDSANDLLRDQHYDLVLLDLNLPGMEGGDVLSNLRRRGSASPVLVLTAREEVDMRIRMLDLGADDYVTKPFDFGEVDARCRALLRRRHADAKNLLSFGNLEMDLNACKVFASGEEIPLKPREFRLLEVFLTHIGKVLSKEELLDHLYGFDESPSPNAIELYVARLRKKVEGSGFEIKTLRGLGYLVEH